MYDLIVIGGGPSGVMAAIQASLRHKKVLLIEKNNRLLKKLEVSGNGRCNLTNNKETKDFMKNVDNSKYFYSIINQFNPKKIIEYFSELNVELKEESDNKIFPVSDDASTISNALIKQLKNTKICLEHTVIGINKDGDIFNVITPKEIFTSTHLLIATGGISYTELGCNINNFELAKSFNHSITKLVAQECPVNTYDPLDQLMGLSLKNKNIIIKDNDKYVEMINGDFIITHFGLSGPAILNCSFGINKCLSNNIELSIQLLNKDYDQTRKTILDIITSQPKRMIKNSLLELLPLGIVELILNKHKLINTKNADLNKKNISALAHDISNFSFKFKSFYQPQYAFLTGGGVNTKELKPKTLESKLVANLYFAGEMVDVCGRLGGYNITIALASGYVVGNQI